MLIIFLLPQFFSYLPNLPTHPTWFSSPTNTYKPSLTKRKKSKSPQNTTEFILYWLTTSEHGTCSEVLLIFANGYQLQVACWLGVKPFVSTCPSQCWDPVFVFMWVLVSQFICTTVL